MSYLPSLPDDAVLVEVFKAFPKTAAPLMDYHQALLRGPSPFSVAERELIAAYVSGLNACTYCHGVHTATAEAFGVPEGLLAALVADVDAAPVDARMRLVLRYVRKLTLTPSRMTPVDAQAVLAAGWDEQALHDAASVCALFNFMNRLVDGLGISADETHFNAAAGLLSSQAGYRLRAARNPGGPAATSAPADR